jgi:hypothetical protein
MVLDYGAMLRRRGVQKQKGKLTLGESTSTLKLTVKCGLLIVDWKKERKGRGGGREWEVGSKQ